MNRLRSLTYRGLLTGLAALWSGGAHVWADPPKAGDDSARTVTKERLDALLKAYKLYELPMPPADAPLVRTTNGTQTYDNGKNIDHYALGFLIKAKKAGDPDRVYWRGGRTDELERRQVVRVVEPRPAALMDEDDFVDVELAVLCHSRGWTELALKVLERNLGVNRESPETELARSAWNHWLSELQKPQTERAKVARLLKVIWEHRQDDFDVYERNLLDSLESSLVPSKAKPGTVEALIDDLIDVTDTDRTGGLVPASKPHPAYLKVARRGFEAVPALIEHLNDERLTRAYKQGFNNFRGYHYHVADVACDLLQGLAGEDLGKSWLRRLQGYRLERTDIEKWWAGAQKLGEEAYFVRHVLGDEPKGNLRNRLMLDVLAHKYPKQLPGLYRQMVNERPEMFGWEMGDAVAASAIAKETKRELFLEATRSKGTHIRLDGIVHLIEVDRTKGVEVLLAELDRVPESPAGSFWNCPESRLAYLVMKANDPAAWAALDKTAKRVDVGLRLEYLNQMTYVDRPEGTREARLRFLGKFLDDPTVRDTSTSSKYEGPYAGFSEFPKTVEVRNFVAYLLAWQFKMDVEPNRRWTEAEWAKLREDVRKALAREGIK